MKILPLIIISTVILYSCEDKKTTTEKDILVSDSIKVVDSTISENNPDSTSEVAPNAIASTISKNNSGVKPALNPEHGKPFHRCDISVGAPIDSAPKPNPTPQTIPQQSASNNNFNTSPISNSVSSPISAPKATGPKPALNPAHGEPYHRCDLKVGEPLT